MLGAGLRPDPTLGVPVGGAEGAGDVFGVRAVAIGFARGLVRFVDTLMVGSVCPVGRSPAAGGPPGAFGGSGDWASPCCGKPNIDANAHAVQRDALDTPRPPAFVQHEPSRELESMLQPVIAVSAPRQSCFINVDDFRNAASMMSIDNHHT
jgi:hypothetical protein